MVFVLQRRSAEKFLTAPAASYNGARRPERFVTRSWVKDGARRGYDGARRPRRIWFQDILTS